MEEKKESIWNKRIEWKYEKQFLILVCMMIYHWFSLYLYDLTGPIPTIFWTRVATIGLKVVMIIPFLIVYFKFSAYKESKIDWKNKKQYLWAFALLIPLFLSYYIQYGHTEEDLFQFRIQYMSAGKIVYYVVNYIFFVGLYEEFKYRVYMQGEMSVVLGRLRVLAPLFAGVFFGCSHLVQGTSLQVRLCIGVGLILGYAKQYIKDCTLVTVVLAHAMYDMIISLVLAG